MFIDANPITWIIMSLMITMIPALICVYISMANYKGGEKVREEMHKKYGYIKKDK